MSYRPTARGSHCWRCSRSRSVWGSTRIPSGPTPACWRWRSRPRTATATITWQIPTRCACTRRRCSTTATWPAWPTGSATLLRRRPSRVTITRRTPARGDTIALVTADAEGWAVSLIQSLWDSFGSGILEPETGIVAHDRAGCFTLGARPPERDRAAETPVPHPDAGARPPRGPAGRRRRVDGR